MQADHDHLLKKRRRSGVRRSRWSHDPAHDTRVSLVVNFSSASNVEKGWEERDGLDIMHQ